MSEVVEMKELLTYIVENLVSEPDAIAITERCDGDNVTSRCAVVAPEIWVALSVARSHRKGNPHTHESGRQSREQAQRSIFSTEPARIAPKVNHFRNGKPVPSGAGFFEKIAAARRFFFSAIKREKANCVMITSSVRCFRCRSATGACASFSQPFSGQISD